MVAESREAVRVCFIDRDGRLEPIIEGLRGLSKPIDVDRTTSIEEASELAATTSFDCFVVRGAMELDGVKPADGIEAAKRIREELPGVEVAIYSVNLNHSLLSEAFEADISIISDAPQHPELVYRQLRHIVGEETHFQSASGLLDSLFSYYPHHLFIKDEVGRFEALSDATAGEYGLDPEAIGGLTDFDLLEYETAIEAYREEQALMDTGERIVERIDHWVDEADRDRWMSITKAPRYDADGNPVGIVGSTREVTKEKHKEQMVRELHSVSRELVRAQSKPEIGRAVMAMTADIPVLSHIQVVLADHSGELDPLGDDQTSETLFDRYGECFRTVIDTGDSQYLAADGTAVSEPERAGDLKAAVLPLGSHGGLGLAADADTFTDFGIDLAHILASNLEAALDRTERERELERQNEHLEEFASIVSHDLRNPLNVASAATELLAEDVDSPHTERITRALDRMEQLIEALLTLAREGQVVGETQFVALETAAQSAWDVVDAPEATLDVESTGLLPADENRLSELFENLFRNSVEHGSTSSRPQADDTVEHGHEDVAVTVGVREDRDGFFVADDGPGIDPDARERLFEMGYSGADGTGYGLYIVSTIADAHGWTVEAGESERGGARFDVVGAAVETDEGS